MKDQSYSFYTSDLELVSERVKYALDALKKGLIYEFKISASIASEEDAPFSMGNKYKIEYELIEV